MIGHESCIVCALAEGKDAAQKLQVGITSHCLACLGRRYSEVLQRAELKRHVLALAYGYAAALTFAAASVGDMRNTGSTPLTSPLLAPLNVLLQWLSTQPDYVRCATPVGPCTWPLHIQTQSGPDFTIVCLLAWCMLLSIPNRPSELGMQPVNCIVTLWQRHCGGHFCNGCPRPVKSSRKQLY